VCSNFYELYYTLIFYSFVAGFSEVAEEMCPVEQESSSLADPIPSAIMNLSSHSATVTPPAQTAREVESADSNKKRTATTKVPGRPSLAKIVLSLESSASQQHALQQILNALQIINAREALVAALAPHHSATVVKGIILLEDCFYNSSRASL